MKKLSYCGFIFVLFLSSGNSQCFAQKDASQIDRQQELLEEDAALRQRIESKGKVFIKEIVVKGASLLSEDEIKEITLPFKERWLSNEDIRQIAMIFIQVYGKKGLTAQVIPEARDNILDIQVKEDLP